jgi:hypothetical protein
MYAASLVCLTLRRMHGQYKTGNVPLCTEHTAFPHEFAKHFLLTHFYGKWLHENQNSNYSHYARIWKVCNDPKYFVRISNIKFYQNQSGDCRVQTWSRRSPKSAQFRYIAHEAHNHTHIFQLP